MRLERLRLAGGDERDGLGMRCHDFVKDVTETKNKGLRVLEFVKRAKRAHCALGRTRRTDNNNDKAGNCHVLPIKHVKIFRRFF